MQRWLIAVGTLLFGAVSISLADYVVIRVILSNQADGGTNNPNNPYGGEGFSPMGGMTGGPRPGGSNIGFPSSGGNLGIMGGSSPMGGFMGSGGRGPMGPMGGNRGIMGGSTPMGGIQGGGPGPMGPMGGNRGIMGGGPMGGQFGQQGGQPNSGETLTKIKFDPNTMVMVVIDLQDRPEMKSLGGQQYPQISHKWKGTTYVYNDSTILVDILKKPSVSAQYANRFKALAAKRTPEATGDLAEWCLTHGLVTECLKHMDELVAIYDKDKTKVTGKYAVAVEAYKKVKEESFDKAIAPNAPDAAEQWKNALGYENVARSEHYTLVHNTDRNSPEVARRLEQLEKNYRAVMLWFAMRGKVLKLPQSRMLAVLADKTSDLTHAKSAFQPDTELTADGMLAQRENVAFFCTTRIDPTFLTFTQMTRAIENDGWSTAELLKGSVPRKKGTEATKAEDAARAQTLVLVERALIEESELSAVTSVGTRQILVAAKMMPRYVDAPEWFDFGLPSVFETPKGPYAYETSQVKVAFWQGYGMPSWAYMQLYSELSKPPRPEITKSKAAEYLRETLTDRSFEKAREPISPTIPDEIREKMVQAKQKEMPKARMFAWSLSYYLARKRAADLEAFIRELDSMPRELEFDGEAKLQAFARAFGLVKNGKIDEVAFKKLADDWFLDLGTLQSPVLEMKLEDPKADPMNDPSNPYGNPGGGFPSSGGPGGPGGGFGAPRPGGGS